MLWNINGMEPIQAVFNDTQLLTVTLEARFTDTVTV